jgi:hypothetical protein
MLYTVAAGIGTDLNSIFQRAHPLDGGGRNGNYATMAFVEH